MREDQDQLKAWLRYRAAEDAIVVARDALVASRDKADRAWQEYLASIPFSDEIKA